MDAPSSIDSRHSEAQLTNGGSLSPPKSFLVAPSVSMFDNANNIFINNSSFNISSTINYNTINGPSAVLSLDLLYRCTAPNAILNSGGRTDEVGCHPGTRGEVIGLVEKFINAQGQDGPRILWLSGPAGAGKSAIMQTVAERCVEQGVPQANFFFFRTDGSRNATSPLVATLIHQVIQLYPSVGPTVATTLSFNPLIFQMGLQKQFDALMNEALTAIHQIQPGLQPLALLIDGLDECDSETKTGQRRLLQALDALVIQKGTYLRIIVASRVEPQISMAFKQLRSQVDSIFLDDQYSPERDIHLFVTSEFERIKSTHYLADTLDRHWPTVSNIESIVSKSSGQFIYAATVMRFIAHSSASPVLNLQRIQGIVPPAKNTPFAQLDAVYTYILDQVDDLEAVKTIFAIKWLGQDVPEYLRIVMEAYKPTFSDAVFHSCMSELAPLVNKRRHHLEFFHASFPDFLLDSTRARRYHVDLEIFCAAAIPSWWVYRKHGFNAVVYIITAKAFDKVKKPTLEITTALMEPHPMVRLSAENLKAFRGPLEHLISNLYRIYAPQHLQSFIEIMRTWVLDAPNLAEILRQDPFNTAI